MATFKMVKRTTSRSNRKGPSGATGGITTLPHTRNDPSKIKPANAFASGSGKAAVGTFADQVTRVAANAPAHGQDHAGKKALVNSGSIMGTHTTGKGRIGNLGKFAYGAKNIGGG